MLQTQGLITSSTGPGRGTRIAPAQGSALARIFQLHFALSDTGSGDLTETRVALERSSAALAAQRGTPESLRRLADIVAGMAAAERIDDFNELDTEFHVLVARAGQNQLIADLTVAVRQAVRDAIRNASDALPDWPRFRARAAARAPRDPRRDHRRGRHRCRLADGGPHPRRLRRPGHSFRSS